MNNECENPKLGLIGELLAKIRLNQFGVNTGSVDIDTGTDIVMFYNKITKTAQVKTSIHNAPANNCRVVDVLLQVHLVFRNKQYFLDESRIDWRFSNASVFKPLDQDSLNEIFIMDRTNNCA